MEKARGRAGNAGAPSRIGSPVALSRSPVWPRLCAGGTRGASEWGMQRSTMAFVSGLLISLVGTSVARAEEAATAAPAPPAPVVWVPAQEQPRTLLSRPIHHSGYGAPVVSYTRFADRDSVLVGGRGGWILNHQFVIGGGGFGLATPARQSAVDQADYQHTFGYGGLWLEYLIAPMNVVHGSVGTLVGAGGITYQRFRPASLAKDQESTSVFVLDPVVAVEVNVTSFLRIALQGGYRVVRGVDLASLSNGDASGFTLGGALKVGGF